jgi:ribosomal protein S27AE
MVNNQSTNKTLLVEKKPEKRVQWMHCPRCMNGNMYLDLNEEYVCIQCGYIKIHSEFQNIQTH